MDFREWQIQLVEAFDSLLDERAEAFGGKKVIREQLSLPESFFGECRRKARIGRLPLERMFRVVALLGIQPGVWLYRASQAVDGSLPELVREPPTLADLPVGSRAREVLQRLERAN